MIFVLLYIFIFLNVDIGVDFLESIKVFGLINLSLGSTLTNPETFDRQGCKF